MGELRSQDKRDKLRLLYARTAAVDGESGKTLHELLMAALKTADDAVSSGAFLVGTSEAGGSLSFQILSEYSPVVARRLVGELLDLYDKAVAHLEDDADDSATFDLMMGSLRPIRTIGVDFTGLRYGTGAYTVESG